MTYEEEAYKIKMFKEGKMDKQPKKDFRYYQTLMKNKFDLEDRMAKIHNERWKLNNENIKCEQQLRLVEDQLRGMFQRIRIETKKDDA